MCRLKFRPFLKVGALLRLAERSEINDIWAYCDLRRVAADCSDLCGNVPLQIPTFLKVGALLTLSKRSGINDIPAYCDLRRVAADHSDLCGNVPPQIPTFAAMCRLKFRLYKH